MFWKGLSVAFRYCLIAAIHISEVLRDNNQSWCQCTIYSFLIVCDSSKVCNSTLSSSITSRMCLAPLAWTFAAVWCNSPEKTRLHQVFSSVPAWHRSPSYQVAGLSRYHNGKHDIKKTQKIGFESLWRAQHDILSWLQACVVPHCWQDMATL